MSESRHKYEYEVDLSLEVAGTKLLRFVGRDQRVLELGAGPGSITRVLKERNGCRVTAIERDPTAIDKLSAYCEKVYPLDLNEPGWSSRLAAEARFETVVAADVLEHLYDPWSTMREIKTVLAHDGHLVVSLPHAGHCALMARLGAGDFEYREVGLLDRTHIRFFGLHNMERMFIDAGFKILAADFVIVPPEQTEFAEGWQRTSRMLRDALAQNPFASVYQVIVKAQVDAAPESGLKLESIPVAASLHREIGPGSAMPEAKPSPPNPRLVAFYLPQFHPIPENDAWWGKGFTEWTNVTKAQPMFQGHYQPHLPTDFGFYDLRLRETQREQIRVAKQFGIDAFCYHYYWFSGKRLLSQPIDDMLRDPDADMPFCLCWANENWTRTWDAAEHEILIAQEYRPDDDLGFIQGVLPYLLDPRYLRLNGVPVLIVYRPQKLPDSRKSTQIWRDYCRHAGIGEIHLCAALTHGNAEYAGFGFDSGVQFPPHNLTSARVNHRVNFHQPFHGSVVMFEDMARENLERADPARNVFLTVVPSWDNSARVHDRALVTLNANPDNYERWLAESIRVTQRDFPGQERLVFINAWNEWAEGCHLEPDRKHGTRFLEATLRAKSGLSTVQAFTSKGSLPEEAPEEPSPPPETIPATNGAKTPFAPLLAWVGRHPHIEKALKRLMDAAVAYDRRSRKD